MTLISSAQVESLPSGFRFVGNYQMEKRVKIRDGKPIPVAMAPFVCRIYTDGVSLRIYGDGSEEGFTTFSIYRSDGVMVETGAQAVDTVAGVQARTLVGNVLRQLTLTGERMVLTKFPALSDVMDVSYANRRIDLHRANDEPFTTR
jgi:hypothetical protein